MKKIMKESLIKSIFITTGIALALTSIAILVHSCLGITENQKWLNTVNDCIKDKKYCEKDWDNDIIENANNHEEHWANDFDKLEERYSNKYQVVANWTRKNHTECSIIWMTFYRDMILFNSLIGIIIGIVLHFIMKKKAKKKRS